MNLHRHIHPDSADKILRAAFIELGIEGASTHSFRRTCLTQMHRSGVPLKVIQKIFGHKTLSALQKYLEVLDEEMEVCDRYSHILITRGIATTSCTKIWKVKFET